MTIRQYSFFPENNIRENVKANKIEPQDHGFHDWYRFVLSFPPHLVRDYIDNFGLNENSHSLQFKKERHGSAGGFLFGI